VTNVLALQIPVTTRSLHYRLQMKAEAGREWSHEGRLRPRALHHAAKYQHWGFNIDLALTLTGLYWSALGHILGLLNIWKHLRKSQTLKSLS